MITFNIVNGNIVGSVGGKPFTVSYSKELWDDLKAGDEAIQKADDIDQVKTILKKFNNLVTVQNKQQAIQQISRILSFDSSRGTYHMRLDKNVSRVAIPNVIIEKIKYAHDKGLPVDPLIKYIVRVLKNPQIQDKKHAQSFINSVSAYVTQTFVSPVLKEKALKLGYTDELAEKYATVPQTPITMEGLIMTKKVVTPAFDMVGYEFGFDDNGLPYKKITDSSDKAAAKADPTKAEDWIFRPAIMGTRGDAFWSGKTKGHEIRIGEVTYLDSWDQVDCNPNNSCCKGLHAGNQDYVDSLEKPQNITLNMETDPMDIGAIPVNDVNGVLRAVRMRAHSVKDRTIENRNIYHGSTFAAMNDKAWKEAQEEIIDKFN